MKIVHISIYPDKNEKHSNMGGVAAYTKSLITNLPYLNDMVYVLCNKFGSKNAEYVEKNIRIIRCFDRNPLYVFQILREIYRIKPSVTHIQQELHLYGNILTAILLPILILLLPNKVIVTIHGVVSFKEINEKFISENNSKAPVVLVKIAFWVIYKPILLFADRIIVHEDYFKSILVKEYGAKAKKISVVNLGIENLTPIEKGEACKRLGYTNNLDIVLFVGYLTGYKGLDLLIDGFSLYSEENPNSFLIIGAGMHPKLVNDEKYNSDYARFQKMAESKIPKAQYEWVGFIKEEMLPIYYSAADVSVYPYTISMSSSGPMGIAIGYEKPFLASEVFISVFQDSELLFKRSATDLANKLKNFFTHRNKYQAIVKKLKLNRSLSVITKKTYGIYT